MGTYHLIQLLSCHPESFVCHSEPFDCHPERSEGSQGKRFDVVVRQAHHPERSRRAELVEGLREESQCKLRARPTFVKKRGEG